MGKGKARVKIIDRDKGLKALLKMARKVKGAKKVTAGLHGDSRAAAYGYIHEFGKRGRDSRGRFTSGAGRSFIRSTFDANLPKYQRMAKEAAGELIDGKITPEEALERVAEEFVNDVQDTILRLDLIDTGDLHDSINHRRQ